MKKSTIIAFSVVGVLILFTVANQLVLWSNANLVLSRTTNTYEIVTEETEKVIPLPIGVYYSYESADYSGCQICDVVVPSTPKKGVLVGVPGLYYNIEL